MGKAAFLYVHFGDNPADKELVTLERVSADHEYANVHHGRGRRRRKGHEEHAQLSCFCHLLVRGREREEER